MHPLTPLLPDEIAACVAVLKAGFLLPAGSEFQFKAVTLQEPAKASLLAWNEGAGGGGPKPPRQGYLCYYIKGTDRFYEALVELSSSSAPAPGRLLSNTRVGAGMHGPADGPETIAVEQVALADAGVRAEIAKLQLPAGSLVRADPWIYGSDGVADARRQFQCFLYLLPDGAANPDGNHYAFPLSVSPVVDVQTMAVVRIDRLPTGADATPTPPRPYYNNHSDDSNTDGKNTNGSGGDDDDNTARSSSRPMPPASEYTPEHQKLRTDLKPLHVVQPEGASFVVTEEAAGSGGAVIDWQKWRFRTGFNHREGLVLYNITYDGRSVVYRAALSDLCISYADPRPPYHRKAAFDLGDAGAGVMANNLALGCDCLGSIHYLSSHITTADGAALVMPNVVCIHEQDAGIGFKHTNYRTERAVVTRARELVVQAIITVSNYEYILAFVFGQSGDFHYEVRATGILSTNPIDCGLPHAAAPPWGTVVHPGVLAAHHQHIFSLRVDPAVDGPGNRVVYEEAHALPPDPQTNPFGVGYRTVETPVRASGGYDLLPAANRTFKVQSLAHTNAINGLPTAYRLSLPPFQPLLALPSSFNHARAEFADHAVYVTRYREGELYAAGRWTNQSRGGQDGVRTWSRSAEDVDGEPVLFVQFGINHIPRCEDFPVMPCETLRVGFKPCNFFERNPGIDVPQSTQEVNRSVLLSAPLPSVSSQAGLLDGGGGGCCGKN